MLTSRSKKLSVPHFCYYLELAGEAAPQFDSGGADVLAHRGEASKLPPPAIYEYTWTLRQVRVGAGAKEQEADMREQEARENERSRMGKLFRGLFRRTSRGPWMLNQTSHAHISLLFPHTHGWHVNELATSLRSLPPMPNPSSISADVEKVAEPIQPILGIAGAIANTAGSLGAGPVASATGHVLDAVAKAKINSVTPSEAYPWWVQKVSPMLENELYDGIVWVIPVKLLQAIGTRVSGTVAVSFLRLGARSINRQYCLRAWARLPIDDKNHTRLPREVETYVDMTVEPEE